MLKPGSTPEECKSALSICVLISEGKHVNYQDIQSHIRIIMQMPIGWDTLDGMLIGLKNVFSASLSKQKISETIFFLTF